MLQRWWAFTTPCSIWPAQDLNLRPPVPEIITLLLNRLDGRSWSVAAARAALTESGQWRKKMPNSIFRFLFFFTLDLEVTLDTSTSKWTNSKLSKLDVLCSWLLVSQNDFHWQLGGQINHSLCSHKQLESLMHRAGQRYFKLLALISRPLRFVQLAERFV